MQLDPLVTLHLCGYCCWIDFFFLIGIISVIWCYCSVLPEDVAESLSLQLLSYLKCIVPLPRQPCLLSVELFHLFVLMAKRTASSPIECIPSSYLRIVHSSRMQCIQATLIETRRSAQRSCGVGASAVVPRKPRLASRIVCVKKRVFSPLSSTISPLLQS